MNKKAFGKSIKKYREEKNLTQKELAEKISTVPQTVSSWECGLTYPDMESLEALCRAMDIKEQDIFETERQIEAMDEKRNIRGAVIKVLAAVLVAGGILAGAFAIYKGSSSLKQVKSNEKQYGNSLISSDDITKIKVCMGQDVEYSGGKYCLTGDYTILCSLESQYEINEFVGCFENWEPSENRYLDEVPKENMIWFMLDNGKNVACSLDKKTIEAEENVDKKSRCAGLIGVNGFWMPDKLAEYATNLYEENIGKATKLSDSEFALVDDKHGEFLDFSIFNSGFATKDAKNMFYQIVRLSTDAEPGMDYDEFFELIREQGEECIIDDSIPYLFMDSRNVYTCPTEADENYSGDKVLCYYSGKNLIGVVYFRIRYHIPNIPSLNDYYREFARKYCDENNIKVKEFDDPLYYVNILDDKIITERPVITNDNLTVEVYYYNLNELEKREYSGMCCDYEKDRVGSFYITNEQVTRHNYEFFKPESYNETICIARGKVAKRLSL